MVVALGHLLELGEIGIALPVFEEVAHGIAVVIGGIAHVAVIGQVLDRREQVAEEVVGGTAVDQVGIVEGHGGAIVVFGHRHAAGFCRPGRRDVLGAQRHVIRPRFVF